MKEKQKAQLICYSVHKEGEEKDRLYNEQVGGDSLSPNKVRLLKKKLAKAHNTETYYIAIVNVMPMAW